MFGESQLSAKTSASGEFMSAPKLVIKKKMLFIQGKVRPCCQVQAFVSPELQAALDEHFHAETLFKRAAYASSWPANALEVPAALAPALSAFLKNDACPEITVKTITASQMHQAANVWEMMAFEFIAKLAFENFLALSRTVSELGVDVIYDGVTQGGDLAAFTADTSAERIALENEAIAA